MSQDENVDFYKAGDHDSNNSHRLDAERDGGTTDKGRRTNRTMSWNAPEFMEIQRGLGWYSGLALTTAALAALIYLTSKDYFAVGSIIALGIVVAIFVSRKPQNVDYKLSDSGIEVGRRQYRYSQFKSFTIIRDGQISSVELLPLKRFMLPVSAPFAPEDEKQVSDIIGEHLPYAEHKPGFVDKISQRLRL